MAGWYPPPHAQQWYQGYGGRPPGPPGPPDPRLHPGFLHHQQHPPQPHMASKDWSDWSRTAASQSVHYPPHPPPPPLPYERPGGWGPSSEPATHASYPQRQQQLPKDDDDDRSVDENLGPLPTNPGSQGHPNNCKPCNKYNPQRPADSCKHDDKCDFCHMPHERPKHRGQRGRHALQRRQYLESREDMPKFLRDLVDQIYTVPHREMDAVKGLLQNLEANEREEKCKMVLARIRDIGITAQSQRPDHARLRGAVIDTSMEGQASTGELDGRCKWLIGTLHLMVRKMHDSKEPQAKIEESVQNVLTECHRLRDVVTGEHERQLQAQAAEDHAGQGGLDGERSNVELRIPKIFNILHDMVHDMLFKESADSSEIDVLNQSFEQAEDKTSPMNDEERSSLVQLLQGCGSLQQLKECLKENEIYDKSRNRFMDEMEGLEDFHDLEQMQSVGITRSTVSCVVTWKGGEFNMKHSEGSTAGALREAIPKYLTALSADDQLVAGAPTVHPSQVHLGVMGLPVELDYDENIPQLVQEDLRLVIVRKPDWKEGLRISFDLAGALQKLSEDEDWCSPSGFALIAAMVAALDSRYFSTALKNALTAKWSPASVLELIKEEMGAEDFERVRDLVGEPSAHLRLELGERFKYLEDKINTWTQQEMKTGRSINRIRAILDDIVLEVEELQAEEHQKQKLHDASTKAELEERFASSGNLGMLLERIRQARTDMLTAVEKA